MLIGAHVSSSGGLVKAIDRAEALGCETMQIFNQSPRMWRPTAYSEADFERFRDRLAASSVESVFIHAVYLINVASTDADVRRKSLASLTHALRVGDAIGAGGVIVHPGSGKERALDKTLEMIGTACGKALAQTERCPLLFENTAGAGGTIGRSFEELGRLVELAGADERAGVCLDSCHLLASGYEIRDMAARAAVIDECERDLGTHRLMALHLNDSMTPLGSNRDRHANLGDGEIGEQGIVAFLSDKRFRELPVLLEVPGPEKKGPDKRQVEIAKRLRKRALAA
ncbi:MAG: deoxyribonuclease IV [Solirubrobacterales bacterium]